MRLAVLAALALAACAAPLHRDVELHPSSSWITYGSADDPAAAATHPDFAILDHVSRQLSAGHYSPASAPAERTVDAVEPDTLSTTVRTKLSNFVITVADAPRNLKVLPAVRMAASIVEHSWPSRVPVNMRVAFAPLGGQNVLANGGGTHFARMRKVFHEIVPVAAAESFLGEDFNAREKGNGRFDVLVTVNTNTPWYVGIDGNAPRNQYDLVTVLLHEIYHNLIFTGGIFVEVAPNPGASGGVHAEATVQHNLVTRFDSFLADKAGCKVLDLLSDRKLQKSSGRSGTELLAQAVANDSLFFGFTALGRLVKLHAPRVFLPKSSIYHVDPETVGADSMMSPIIRPGHSQHQVGPVILKMQGLFLNPDVTGANPNCPRPLSDPAPGRLPDSRSGSHEPSHHPTDGGVAVGDTSLGRVFYAPRERRLSRGAIIALSVVGALLLLGLCFALALVALGACSKKPPAKGGGLGDEGEFGMEDDMGRYYGGEDGMEGEDESGMYAGAGGMAGGRPTVSVRPPPPVSRPPSSRRSTSKAGPIMVRPPVQPPIYRPPSSKCPPRSTRPPSSKCPPPPPPPPRSKCPPPSSSRPSRGSSAHPPCGKPKGGGHGHRHSGKPSRSTRPASRAPSSRAPKTEDYFDCR